MEDLVSNYFMDSALLLVRVKYYFILLLMFWLFMRLINYPLLLIHH